jgi:hypothetical protein
MSCVYGYVIPDIASYFLVGILEEHGVDAPRDRGFFLSAAAFGLFMSEAALLRPATAWRCGEYTQVQLVMQ